MKRNEVQEIYTWRKEDIFLSAAEWDRQLALLNRDMVGVLKFKGRLGIRQSLLECFAFTDDIARRIEKMYCYAMLYRDEDLGNAAAQELKSKIENILISYNAYAAFITPELSNLGESELTAFIEDPAFRDYDYQLKTILKSKAHILSEGEERVLALAGKTTAAFSEIFSQIDNIDLPFGTVNIDGKAERMTHGRYSKWLHHPDRSVRKRSFTVMYKAVESLLHTTAATYSASVSKDNFLAAVRGYGSALEKSLYQNDVPKEVYTTLTTETEKYLPSLHEYMGFRKSLLGLDQLRHYDLHVPLFENAEIAVPFDKAYEIVIEGLRPMGTEYLSMLRLARQNRWIDVCETENKRSGAYSCGVYGVHPYVLLNYKETTHDVFTIAHEMGHAMHSFYSSKYQPYAKNDYSIFVAEVASTVNEVLLLKYLLDTAKDKNTKRYLLSYYLDMFRTTLFRQTMFAEFESLVHTAESSGTPLTLEYFNKQYMKLNKKYYGPHMTHDKQIGFEWARIPHFYRAFYVYQYATGLVSAVNIANAIRTNQIGAFDMYKVFLSAGGSKSPYEILKEANVDLRNPQAYNTAFGEFRAALKELKTLC